jgi:ribonuclease P protein component
VVEAAARPQAEEPRDPERGGVGEQRLPRSARVRRTLEIRGLFKRGKRKRTEHLDVFFAASPAALPRIGILVPKHRHRVVERNLLKRRLKEIGRTRVLPALRQADRAFDVLVRVRPEAYDASFAELRGELDVVTEGLCCAPPSSR